MTVIPHTVLQHRTLEAIVFQWDGTQRQAIQVTAELKRELEMRDADLVGANARLSTREGSDLHFRIVRKSDNEQWSRHLTAEGSWLVLWLHENRLHDVEVMTQARGESRFRPQRPIVMLQPRTQEVTDA